MTAFRVIRRDASFATVLNSTLANGEESGRDRIRTCDLEVMSLASYQTAPPGVKVPNCLGDRLS